MEADRYSMACKAPTTTSLTPAASEEEAGLRRGQWTVEEDVMLLKYIETHGEGRWDSLAASSGLRRTGKSCRLRWMNYLRPDVRRGNITPKEQLLILELHSQFGNRWSKIAQHLPGRTDNEIKNYWRTKVLKHAKQLRCDVSSQKFKDVMQYLWMPRLLEKIRAASCSCPSPPAPANGQKLGQSPESSSSSGVVRARFPSPPESDSTAADCCDVEGGQAVCGDRIQEAEFGYVQSPGGYCNLGSLDFEQWEMGDNLWNFEDIWS